MATIGSSVHATVVLGQYANPLGTSTVSYQESVTISGSGAVNPQNRYSGVAYGAVGIYSNLAGVTLTNEGTVTGADAAQFGNAEFGLAGGNGVDAVAQVSIDNSGTITGGTGGEGGMRATSTTLVGDGGTGGIGVDLSAANSTLMNSGSITGGGANNQGQHPGGGGVGVAITAAVTATNVAAGTITGGQGGNSDFFGGAGGVGVTLSDGTVKNYGTITGGQGGDATGYEGSSTPHFIAGDGGVGVNVTGGTLTNESTGQVTGGAAGGNFEYAGATGGVGVNVATGATLNNDGAITGGAGGPNELGPGGNGGAGIVFGDGTTFNDSGTVTGGAGSNSNGYGAGSGGMGVVFGANMTLNLSGKISAGANGINYPRGGSTPQISASHAGVTPRDTASGVTYGYSLAFAARGGDTLNLDKGASLTGAVTGFDKDDTIHIANDGTDIVTFDSATDTLITSNYGSIHFIEPAGTTFTLKIGADGSATLTNDASAACYRRGTRILTPRGEVAIESLAIGDRVTTLASESTILWIGRRRYTGEFAAGNRDVLPVVIRTGALSPGIPKRDLWVSPSHAVLVDGLLVPARALVNGHTILQETAVDEVTYLHLELEQHEILFAEGAHAESYVDDESRAQFDNAAEYEALFPHRPAQQARFCAPYVEEGEALERVRARLHLSSVNRSKAA